MNKTITRLTVVGDRPSESEKNELVIAGVLLLSAVKNRKHMEDFYFSCDATCTSDAGESVLAALVREKSLVKQVNWMGPIYVSPDNELGRSLIDRIRSDPELETVRYGICCACSFPFLLTVCEIDVLFFFPVWMTPLFNQTRSWVSLESLVTI